jgi:hypothetical protein
MGRGITQKKEYNIQKKKRKFEIKKGWHYDIPVFVFNVASTQAQKPVLKFIWRLDNCGTRCILIAGRVSQRSG